MIDIDTNDVYKANNIRFYDHFGKYHREWMRELVSKYKARGLYPVFPTQIAEYYQSREDKEIAVMTSLCMDWNDDTELLQISSMRALLGESPWRWFSSREFVILSLPKNQQLYIDGAQNCRYWRLAKFMDILYDICKDGDRMILPSDAFRRIPIEGFLRQVKDTCGFSHLRYKRCVMELYLRSSDGIGCGLWKDKGVNPSCPVSSELRKFLLTWVPFTNRGEWTWDESVSLFELEHDYDFFYAFLAYKELARKEPAACRRYVDVYRSRMKNGCLLPRAKWLGSQGKVPKIEF